MARTGRVLGLGLAIIVAVPFVAHAKPCKGNGRLQLRWSQKDSTAVVVFSATQCDVPPACATAGSTTDGTPVTKPPITITIRDASGKLLTSVIDPTDPSCAGRCGHVNRGGCQRGADSYRLAGAALRYAFATAGQASVTASKLRIPSSTRPDLTAPVTVTISDASGYAVDVEMKNCRERSSGSSVAVSCF